MHAKAGDRIGLERLWKLEAEFVQGLGAEMGKVILRAIRVWDWDWDWGLRLWC